MATYTAKVTLLFEVDEASTEIPDALNSILTEQMRKYSGEESCLIDWQFNEGDAAASIKPVNLPAEYEPDNDIFPT